MRTGLAASTVTPGNTAPDASFTTPVNVLCACAIDGSASRANPSNATLPEPTNSLVIAKSFQLQAGSQRPANPDLPIVITDDGKTKRHESEWSIALEMRPSYKNIDKSCDVVRT